MRRVRTGLAILVLLIAGGCQHGFASTESLEQAGLGPTACAQSCRDMGMEMAAIVLVQHSYSGCVCQPTPSAGGEGLSALVAGVAGGQVAIDVAQQQSRQHQARR